MKRAMIIYAIIFLATLLIPMLSMIKPQADTSSELVTLFNSASVLLFN